MDICLYGKNKGIPAAQVAEEIGLAEEQVLRVYKDIEHKRSTTRYLHLSPQLIEEVGEISHLP
jgi:NAD+ synthase